MELCFFVCPKIFALTFINDKAAKKGKTKKDSSPELD